MMWFMPVTRQDKVRGTPRYYIILFLIKLSADINDSSFLLDWDIPEKQKYEGELK